MAFSALITAAIFSSADCEVRLVRSNSGRLLSLSFFLAISNVLPQTAAECGGGLIAPGAGVGIISGTTAVCTLTVAGASTWGVGGGIWVGGGTGFSLAIGSGFE